MFALRHSLCEVDEKRRFLSHVPITSHAPRRQRNRVSETVAPETPAPSSPDAPAAPSNSSHTDVTTDTSQACKGVHLDKKSTVSSGLNNTSQQTNSLSVSLNLPKNQNNHFHDNGSNHTPNSSRPRASSMSHSKTRNLNAELSNLHLPSVDSYLSHNKSDYSASGGGWTKRAFPLTEQELVNLSREVPRDDTDTYALRNDSSTVRSRALHVPRTSTSRDVIDYDDVLLESPPQSPASSGSTLPADDKEWTVKEVRTQPSSLIMKIAKR